jgi:NAD+ diphosphatase
MFSTTVLIVVENELGEVVIIKQKNIRAIRYMCLYGMMKIGDSAEMAAIREVKEEFGLDVDKLEYIQSFPDKKREMLIVGFKASVKKSDLKLSSDIDDAEWVDIDEALNLLTNGSYGYKLTKLVKKRRKSQIKI